MSYSATYLQETAWIAGTLNPLAIERLAHELWKLRDHGGRLFIAGLGGSAANASHAANDFRKLCGIEAYALSDNVAELTARANDEGWASVFAGALKASRACDADALLVLSVGGGTADVSVPLVAALDYAEAQDMLVLGIVGRDGGMTKIAGHHVVLVPVVSEERVTPHTEAFQGVVLHCLASHPVLQLNRTKW